MTTMTTKQYRMQQDQFSRRQRMSEPNDKQVEQPKAGELPPPIDLVNELTMYADGGGVAISFGLTREEARFLAHACRQLLAEQQVSAGLREENSAVSRKGQELCAILGNLGIHIHELGLRNAGEMGEWKFRNERAEEAEAYLAEARAENERLKSYRSWERIHELETELADLKYQEAPEKAWVQGFSAGLHAYADTPGAPNFREMRDQILRFDTRPDNPYTPPKESK